MTGDWVLKGDLWSIAVWTLRGSSGMLGVPVTSCCYSPLLLSSGCELDATLTATAAHHEVTGVSSACLYPEPVL